MSVQRFTHALPPPADPGETQIIPAPPVYNKAQPDPPPADPDGVDTIRF